MGQEHFADDETVNHAIIQPRQLQALLCVLLGRVQVVPLVADAGQTKTRVVGARPRLIARHLQNTPVGLGRPMELDVQFLEPPQMAGRQYRGKQARKRLVN